MNAAPEVRTNELRFGDVAREMWRLRVYFIVLVVLSAIAGVLFGLFSEKYYEATVTFTTVSEEGGASRLGALSGLASQYGGLASLAGISLSGGSHRDEYTAVLQSEFLTDKYIRDHDLLPVLYAGQWDSATGRWKSGWRNSTPTVWKANRYFKNKIRSVTDEKKTGMLSLRIKWTDPNTAAIWANDLVALTNSYLKEKAIAELQRNIAYLNEQANKTQNVEERHVIYLLLQEEIGKEMLARGRDEFALKVIDPAVPPEKPSSFGPFATGIFAAAVAALGFFMFVFFRRIGVETAL